MFRYSFLLPFLFLSLLIINNNTAAQDRPPVAATDTLFAPEAELSPADASDYLIRLIDLEDLFRNEDDTLRVSIKRLIDNFREPFDSVRIRLLEFPYDSIELRQGYIVSRDTLPLRWLDEGSFIVDTVVLEKDPFIERQTVIMHAVDDTLEYPYGAATLNVQAVLDSVLQVSDTITEVVIDYAYLQAKNIEIHRFEEEDVQPPLLPPGSSRSLSFLPDSTGIVISDTRQVIMADQPSPFYIVPDNSMPDSLRQSVETLLSHTYERDSILVHFHDINGVRTPFWLTVGDDPSYRYWVKNAEGDSITIWMGNPAKHEITLSLEDDIFVERLEKKPADGIPITTAAPERSLLSISPLEEVPAFWDTGISNSFSLNQNYLSYWARGGESSLSFMFDINARARYNNKESKTHWTTSTRLRFGSTRTKEHGSRISTDIIELNSQFNKEFVDKLDFSSVLYMKTQLAEGFKYPNDSVPVSKFLNPGSITLGMGAEYEPFRNTTINFSILSYRNTFVLDTVNINQRAHGIEEGKRSRQEMGGQMVIKHKAEVLNGLEISNSVRLFSNYLKKPQNVDVDWEMNLEQQLHWNFTVRFNFHLIYNDNVRFPVTDSHGDPVLLPDGSEKKVPRPQINQFLGITLSLRL